MNTVIFSNSFRIIKKHLFQTIIMIFLASMCLYILGAAMNASSSGNTASENYEETYGNKTLYYTSENLSDPIYYSYCEQSDTNIYKKLATFIKSLYDTDKFSFVSLSKQDIQLSNMTVPEQFLYGYEEDYTKDSVVDVEGEKLCTVKSLQVSPKFFTEFSVNVSDGEQFKESDYVLKKGQPIPVILGSAYKDIFEIGNTFKAYYMFDKFDFRVIGFASDKSFYFDTNAKNMVSCERYMIIPALISEEADQFGRISLLDRTNGFINSSIGYEKTKDLFKQYLDNAGIGNWDINIINPQDIGKEDFFDTYSAMTAEVSKQFKIIVSIVIIFSSAINIIVLCSMLRENFQTFGIELLCGSSYKDLIMESSAAVIAIMLISDIIACLFLLVFGNALSSLIIVQFAVLIILILSCLICGIYIRKMKLNTYIGGKE